MYNHEQKKTKKTLVETFYIDTPLSGREIIIIIDIKYGLINRGLNHISLKIKIINNTKFILKSLRFFTIMIIKKNLSQ